MKSPAVATVSSTGLVTAVGYGAATITATYQGMSGPFSFTVTIAGTWTASNINGDSALTWTLTQSGSTVTGMFAFVGNANGVSFSIQTVAGAMSGTTFTWTMTGTVAIDPRNPSCVGTTGNIAGTAQIMPGGTTMVITIAAQSGECDSSVKVSPDVGQSLTFTKQS